MASKNLYLVAFYFARPKRGVNTTRAGWMEKSGNLQYDERVEITRGLKKDVSMAKIVLNLNTKTVEKNGWSDTRDFKELFKYFFKGYHDYITQVMARLDPKFFNEMLDEIQAEHDAANPTAVEVKADEAIPAQ